MNNPTVVLLALALALGCHPAGDTDCSACEQAEDTSDTGEVVDPLGYEVVDVPWSLGEVPAWDPLLVQREGEERDYEACFVLASDGALIVWDSAYGVISSEAEYGSWRQVDATHFEVYWPDPRHGDDDVPATDLDQVEQTWTWLPEQMVVTQADGAEFDADAFPVSGPCTLSR